MECANDTGHYKVVPRVDGMGVNVSDLSESVQYSTADMRRKGASRPEKKVSQIVTSTNPILSLYCFTQDETGGWGGRRASREEEGRTPLNIKGGDWERRLEAIEIHTRDTGVVERQINMGWDGCMDHHIHKHFTRKKLGRRKRGYIKDKDQRYKYITSTREKREQTPYFFVKKSYNINLKLN